MKDTDYAEKQETEGYKRLVDFNSHLHLENLGRIYGCKWSDASGYTTDGRLLNIENKVRNQYLLIDENGNFKVSGTSKNGAYIVDTLFIETHKAGDLYIDYFCEGKIPMYINYLEEDYVVVYNLTRLRKRPEKTYLRPFSKLYNAFEVADREELALTDAYIYKKENNKYICIYRPDDKRR